MEKESLARSAYWRIKDTLDRKSNNSEAKDAINYYSEYFCNSEWLQKSRLQEFSNGYYIGETDINGKRNGIGVYVFNNGNSYLGNWHSGEKNGEGFLASGLVDVFFGEWENGTTITGSNCCSNKGGSNSSSSYSSSSSSSSSKSGCIYMIILLVILVIVLRIIGCVDIGF